MPLFYFRRFEFHPDKKGPGLVKQIGLMLFVVALGAALFGTLIVAPLVMVISQSGR